MGKGFAIVSVVIGIAALLLFWLPVVGWIILPFGVIFGIFAMSKCKTKEEGRGLALTGFLLSMIASILFLLVGLGIQNYVGVFSKPLEIDNSPKPPEGGVPSTKTVCSFDKDFTCRVYGISPRGLDLFISYNLGNNPLDSMEITVTGGCNDQQSISFIKQPGDGGSVALCMNQLTTGSQFSGQFTISYLVQGEQTLRIAHGNISGQVE